jgi:hypothetical protein
MVGTGDYILKDNYIAKGELIELLNGKIFIQIGNPACFESRFSGDRFGDEAAGKIVAYADSLINTNIIFKKTNESYKIVDYNVMKGFIGNIGTLMLWVEKGETNV